MLKIHYTAVVPHREGSKNTYLYVVIAQIKIYKKFTAKKYRTKIKLLWSKNQDCK